MDKGFRKFIFHGTWIGCIAGCFGGLVGLGGGVIMIPLMVEILKFSQHKAHGTSLWALVFTGLIGTITYSFYDAVDVTGGMIMAITAILTAKTGAKFASSLPEWKLKKSFGGFLILVAILLLLKPYLTQIYSFSFTGIYKVGILLFTGLFAGFIAGMMGVGGGTIMVPSMVLLLSYDQHLAQGTSLLCMVPAGLVGAYTHAKFGNVEKRILPGLILGIILGTFIGGNIANALPEKYLRILFAIIIIWTGIRYLKTSKKFD